jgi:tetratricopeptide (TPR) repeat protein
MPAGEFENALETCGALTELVEKCSEQWLESRWFLIDVQGDLLSIYHATNRKDLEKQTVTEGIQHLLDYEHWITKFSGSGGDRKVIYKNGYSGKEEVWSLPNLHQEYYQFALHDFACRCMWTGHYKEAVELFEKALVIRDDAETHFFLAGCILKATGHREKSFEHFRQAVENPSFSRRHELEQAFLGEITFEDVWDDEQYLSFIDREVQKLVQQVKEK